MFASAEIILGHYIKQLSRFDVYLINAHRGENPEDIFYLCHTKDAWFMVYETDYISELSYVVKEAEELLATYGAQLIHWLIRKDAETNLHTLDINISDDDKSLRKLLILDLPGTYLCYAVLKVKMKKGTKLAHYNPTSYGFVEPR